MVETAVSSQGDCAVALGTLRCAIGTIPVGTHLTGVWVETLPQAGVALFRATAIAPEDDPEPAERVVEAEITMQPK